MATDTPPPASSKQRHLTEETRNAMEQYLRKKGATSRLIIAAIRKNVVSWSMHKEGCRLVQTALETADAKDAQALADGAKGAVLPP